MAVSPATQALDTLLNDRKGVSLADYIEIRRQAKKSWRAIALDLRDDTGVDVADKTIRRWAEDLGLDTSELSEVAS